MPYYSFNFKKDDIEIELKTTDFKLIHRVSDKWLEDISDSIQDNDKFKITVAKEPKIEPEQAEQPLKIEYQPVDTSSNIIETPEILMVGFQTQQETIQPDLPKEQLFHPQPSIDEPIVEDSPEIKLEEPEKTLLQTLSPFNDIDPSYSEIKDLDHEQKVVAEISLSSDILNSSGPTDYEFEQIEESTEKIDNPEDINLQETQKAYNIEITEEKVVDEIISPSAISEPQEAPVEKSVIEEIIPEPDLIMANNSEETEIQNIDHEIPETTEEIQNTETSDKNLSISTEEEYKNTKFYQILQKKFSTMSEDETLPESSIPELVNSSTNQVWEDSHSIEALVYLKKPDNLMDYLLLTAYYLKEKELMERYSLKQINSKILPFSKTPIDHAIIQQAVSKNYMEVVPDYTDMTSVTEYTITDEGIDYILNKKS